VIATADAAAVPLPSAAGAVVAGVCWADIAVKPTRQITSAKKLFIAPTFQLKIQPHLRIDSTIAGTRAAWCTTKSTKRAAQCERLPKARRRQVADRRAEIHVIAKILEVDGDVESIALLTRRRTSALRSGPDRSHFRTTTTIATDVWTTWSTTNAFVPTCCRCS